MGRLRCHQFLIDKFDNHRNHKFYMILGIKNKGLDVLVFWLYDREIEKGFIPLEDFWKYDISRTTFECFIRNVVFHTRDENIGWIKPDGYFHSVPQCQHSNFAYWYYGKEEAELEREGFVKVESNNDSFKLAYCGSGIITEAQYIKLQELGFLDKDLKDFSVVH